MEWGTKTIHFRYWKSDEFMKTPQNRHILLPDQGIEETTDGMPSFYRNCSDTPKRMYISGSGKDWSKTLHWKYRQRFLIGKRSLPDLLGKGKGILFSFFWLRGMTDYLARMR